MIRESADNVAPTSFSMYRGVAHPWREAMLRKTATAASAGKSRRKAERRKEAGSSRRKNCPEQAFAENRRAGDQIHRDAIHEVQHISESGKVKRVFVIVVWLGVALLGAGAFGKIAFDRGGPLNAAWFVVAAG